MKKLIRTVPILSLILLISLGSCVSSKKFRASEAQVNKLQKDSADTHGLLNNCNFQVQNLNNEKSLLQDSNALANKNLKTVKNDLNTLSNESQLTIADQAKRLQTFQNLLQSQKDVMTNLKNTISNALLNYKTDELFVYYKDGNVYVSLLDKLLFKSGSAEVDPKGKEALKSLAKVINSTKDIMVLIEGHTDNIPIKTSQFQDNWELSTARATSIVRILTVDNNFDPTRITASGKGMFHPLKPNDSVEGRAANRRTEVILSPDLKELYKLIYP